MVTGVTGVMVSLGLQGHWGCRVTWVTGSHGSLGSVGFGVTGFWGHRGFGSLRFGVTGVCGKKGVRSLGYGVTLS